MTYLIITSVLAIAFLFLRSKKKTQSKSKAKNLIIKNSELAVKWNEWQSNFDPENCSQIQKKFNSKVVGVTYKNKDGSDRQKIISNSRVNEKLLLIPEKYKEDWAILVCKENFEVLGYLNSDLAQEISDLIIRRKSRVDAKISSLTGGNGTTKGVNIELTKYVIKNKPKPKKREKVVDKPYDPNIKMHRLSFERQFQGVELEKKGFVDNAIELYESIVNDKKLQSNDSTLPYSRLTIIYRNRKEYDREIDIIEKWKEMYIKSSRDKSRVEKELLKLDRRLEKIKKLKEKQ